MKRNKTITEKELFYFYPYKKNPPVIGNTIPQPYVKKNDVSNHKYSLTYDVWLSVVDDIIKDMQETLLKGRVIKLPNYLGYLQLKKYKISRKVDWGKTRAENKKMYMYDKDLHSIIIKWNRNYKICRFQNSDHWKIRMGSGFASILYAKTLENPNFQYTIIDV